ncbi:hypothetical protein [Leptolyngbya sp. FACHB-711]|uniref:hypothetical protein n=1 Tax=unclassified Leptolyngbya TaxID=2650499 RepID=UPI0016822B25|nr:hypothetical protein [Leptolyngbya sp. FACHB-711]MBD1852745.1 hypothetical protein [Cyanobacteria bacterium FACHB-502]MBD2023888.1 hypothetical protein [Leptolyngbya sp. FACHB-711]
MIFKISDDRFDELLKIEEEVNCDIGAGYAGAYLPEFLADPIHFQQIRRLQAIVLEAFQSLLNELNLGIGKDAAFTCGRKLVLERLIQPPVTIQQQLWDALQEDGLIQSALQPQPDYAKVKAILRTTLTQADWSAIATAASESIRIQMLEYWNQTAQAS